MFSHLLSVSLFSIESQQRSEWVKEDLNGASSDSLLTNLLMRARERQRRRWGEVSPLFGGENSKSKAEVTHHGPFIIVNIFKPITDLVFDIAAVIVPANSLSSTISSISISCIVFVIVSSADEQQHPLKITDPLLLLICCTCSLFFTLPLIDLNTWRRFLSVLSWNRPEWLRWWEMETQKPGGYYNPGLQLSSLSLSAVAQSAGTWTPAHHSLGKILLISP